MSKKVFGGKHMRVFKMRAGILVVLLLLSRPRLVLEIFLFWRGYLLVLESKSGER